MGRLLILSMLVVGCSVARANEPPDAGVDSYGHMYGGGIIPSRPNDLDDVHILDRGVVLVIVDRHAKKVTITRAGAEDGYACVIGKQ